MFWITNLIIKKIFGNFKYVYFTTSQTAFFQIYETVM